jgi:hypothetical protein
MGLADVRFGATTDRPANRKILTLSFSHVLVLFMARKGSYILEGTNERP